MPNRFPILGFSLVLLVACTKPQADQGYQDEATYSNEANPENEAKPAVGTPNTAPQELVLNFSVNSAANPDCIFQRSAEKQGNTFSIETEALGELVSPGSESGVVRPCTIKGQVLVPAGYIVDLALEKNAVEMDFTLDAFDTAEVLLRLGASFGQDEFSKVFRSNVQGPNLKLGQELRLSPLNEGDGVVSGENLRNISCSDAKLVSQQMDLTIDIEYSHIADASSDRAAGAFIKKLPVFQLKATKCLDAPAAGNGGDKPLNPNGAANGQRQLGLSISDALSKQGCRVLDLAIPRVDSNLVEFRIDPIAAQVNAARTQDIFNCTISGQLTLPANTVLVPRLTTQNVDTDVNFDQATSLALSYEVKMLYGAEQVKFLSSQTLNGPAAGRRNVELQSPDFEGDCALAINQNRTIRFEFLYTSNLNQAVPRQAASTLSILSMPGVQFDVEDCR